jgi:hypothetical protein
VAPLCAAIHSFIFGREANQVEKDTDLEIRKHVQETAENVGIPVE